MTCVSPFHPGAAKQAVLGKRVESVPIKIRGFPLASSVFSRIFLSFSITAHFPSLKSRALALCGGSKTGNADDIFRACAPTHFLTAAAQLRGYLNARLQ